MSYHNRVARVDVRPTHPEMTAREEQVYKVLKSTGGAWMRVGDFNGDFTIEDIPNSQLSYLLQSLSTKGYIERREKQMSPFVIVKRPSWEYRCFPADIDRKPKGDPAATTG